MMPSPSVRAELVEALSFLLARREEGQGFDKLSPNGLGNIATNGKL
jgi:hypothetical protein